MNYKLINIKNLLKIIISCLVVLSMCKSCANAFSNITEMENDIKAKLNILKDNSVISTNFSYNNIGPAYDQYFDYMIFLRPNDKTNGEYTKIWIAYTRRSKANPVQNAYSNHWGKTDYYVGAKGFNIKTGAVTDSYYNYEMLNWSFDYMYTTIAIDTSNMTLGEGEEYGSYYITEPPFLFDFTPYSIDVIDDYNIVKFAYTGNVALGALGDNTFYQLQVRLKDKNLNTIGTAYYDENGDNYYTDNAFVIDNNIIKASTVYLYYTQPYILEFTIYSDSENYEINSYLYKFYPYSAVIENGVIVDSGDTTFNNQDQSIFIVNSIVGELPSGDKPGSGILGGIASLFIPRASFFLEYFNTFNTWLGDHLGILYAPFEIIFNLLNRIINVDFTDPMVEFGPFTLPLNDDIELINHYEYHFNDLLQDDSMAQIHDIYLIIVDGILILGLLYMVYCKYEEIIGGK